ncbi:MAG: hypothetical protein ACR2NM_04900 [Bythopirellula sp.]
MKQMGSLLVLLSFAAAAGCAQKEEIGVIEGIVTCNGQPVTNATLFFRDHDRGIHIMADVQEDGGYQVFTAGGRGLPLGEYRVSVVPTGPEIETDPETGDLSVSRATGNKGPEIPMQYQDVKTSGLVAKVASGRNKFDIEMKSKE